MPKQQFPVSPPLALDVQTLKDYTSVIQKNLRDLFNTSHNHPLMTSAPANTDGNIGDVILVQLDTSPYLYIRFPDPLGWKRILLS